MTALPRGTAPADLTAFLRTAHLSAHERMVGLGAWFVHNIPVRPSNRHRGSDDGLLDHHAESERRPVTAILEDLVACRANVLCGGMAHFMHRVAAEAGFKTFALNLGSRATEVSHVLVLVDVGVEQEIYGVYDPFCGLFISDRCGRPVDLRGIVAAVKSRGDLLGQLRLKRMGPRRKVAVATAQYLARAADAGEAPPAGMRNVAAVESAGELFAWEIDLRRMSAHFGRQLLSWLANRIGQPSVFDLVRFPLGTSGSARAIEFETMLRHEFRHPPPH